MRRRWEDQTQHIPKAKSSSSRPLVWGFLATGGDQGQDPPWVRGRRPPKPAFGSPSCYLTEDYMLRFHPNSGWVFSGSWGLESFLLPPLGVPQGSDFLQGSLAKTGCITLLGPHSKPGRAQQLQGWGLGQSSVISLGGSVSRFSRALSRFSTWAATTRHSSRPCRRHRERPRPHSTSPPLTWGAVWLGEWQRGASPPFPGPWKECENLEGAGWKGEANRLRPSVSHCM